MISSVLSSLPIFDQAYPAQKKKKNSFGACLFSLFYALSLSLSLSLSSSLSFARALAARESSPLPLFDLFLSISPERKKRKRTKKRKEKEKEKGKNCERAAINLVGILFELRSLFFLRPISALSLSLLAWFLRFSRGKAPQSGPKSSPLPPKSLRGMGTTTKAASMLLLLSLLFAVVVALLSSRSSMVSASSTATSARVLAQREALVRQQSGLDHAAQSRNRRKRAALARRGAVVDDGDSRDESKNLDQFESFGDEEEEELLLLEQELQRRLDQDEFEEEEKRGGASSTTAAAAKPMTADSSFTSTYGVPPPRDAAATAATTAATTATTTASSSSSVAASAVAPATTTTTTTAKKPPLDDIFVVINTPHYLGDEYASPVKGCKRTVKAAERVSSASSSSPISSSSTYSSSTTTIPLRCEFSADTSKVKQAHALWYHLPTTGPAGPYSALPHAENQGNPFTVRPATEQVAVAATMESAAYYPNILDPEFMKHFAVESSYRLRSEAMLMYFGEPHVQLWTNLSSIKSFKEKKVCVFEFFCSFFFFFKRESFEKFLLLRVPLPRDLEKVFLGSFTFPPCLLRKSCFFLLLARSRKRRVRA